MTLKADNRLIFKIQKMLHTQSHKIYAAQSRYFLSCALSYYLNAYFLENCESHFCIKQNCCSSYGDQNQINNNTQF